MPESPDLREMLRSLRDTDPATYRELFATLIPLDALPSEVYSDRQLELIYDAMSRALARRARRSATLH
jgi:hypothetical protein